MSKKKKPSPKQTKQSVQKPQTKASKDDSAPQKASVDAPKKKEAQAKPAQPQSASAKSTESAPAKVSKTDTSKPKSEASAASASKAEVKPASKTKTEANSEPKTEVKPKPTPETKPSAKPEAKKTEQVSKQSGGKGKGKKKNKGSKPTEAVEAPSLEETEAEGETFVEMSDAAEPASADSPEAAQSVSASEVTDAGGGRKVPKTLVDDEVASEPGTDSSEGDAPIVENDSVDVEAPAAHGEAPRKLAKTMLEVDIGNLAEAAAKATGTQHEIPQPRERKIAKTLMEMDTTGLRDAVESSSKAIEDEIAAAIKEAETADVEVPPSNAAVNKKVSTDRPIAKTLLDVRAEDLFELVAAVESEKEESEQSTIEASTEISTGVESDPSGEPVVVERSAPPEARKVPKTLLESDSPDISKIVAQANEIASGQITDDSEAAAPEKPQAPGTNEVSIEDLSEFAKALKDDKPMSAPTPRVERLRKTMMNIRKHGLASSSSLPKARAPKESIQTSGIHGQVSLADLQSEEADVGSSGASSESEPMLSDTPSFSMDAKQTPLRVSRSLHTMDNLSIDPAGAPEVETFDKTVEAPLPAFESIDATPGEMSDDSALVQNKHTGTVEISQDPHAAGSVFDGVTTVWPQDQEHQEQQTDTDEASQPGMRKPERFVARTMIDMDFLKDSLSASVQRAEEKMAESIAQKLSEPQKQLLTQDDYKLAKTGCPFAWGENPDNPKDRVKYCTECNAQVYNFSGFDMAEAQSLIFKRENRTNAPLFKREDGKFMTVDCPIASKKKKDNQMLIGGAALILILLIIMVVASFLSPQPPPAPPATSDQPADFSSPPDSPPTDAGTTTGAPPSSGSDPAGGVEKSSRPGAYHYVRGKGVVQQNPVIVKPQEPTDNTIPGTTSGFDEGGQFWKYQDQGNN